MNIITEHLHMENYFTELIRPTIRQKHLHRRGDNFVIEPNDTSTTETPPKK